MIFKYALTPRSSRRNIWVGLYYNQRGRISRSGTSTHASRGILKDLAIALPRVCRQIYVETALVLYSENRFAFKRGSAMHKWLSKRIKAQREAIRWMMLPCIAYQHGSMERNNWVSRIGRKEITKDAKKTCLNLVEMVEDNQLDSFLRNSRAFDGRCRSADPSSGDELYREGSSDY
jgi:hypothetical protein